MIDEDEDNDSIVSDQETITEEQNKKLFFYLLNYVYLAYAKDIDHIKKTKKVETYIYKCKSNKSLWMQTKRIFGRLLKTNSKNSQNCYSMYILLKLIQSKDTSLSISQNFKDWKENFFREQLDRVLFQFTKSYYHNQNGDLKFTNFLTNRNLTDIFSFNFRNFFKKTNDLYYSLKKNLTKIKFDSYIAVIIDLIKNSIEYKNFELKEHEDISNYVIKNLTSEYKNLKKKNLQTRISEEKQKRSILDLEKNEKNKLLQEIEKKDELIENNKNMFIAFEISLKKMSLLLEQTIQERDAQKNENEQLKNEIIKKEKIYETQLNELRNNEVYNNLNLEKNELQQQLLQLKKDDETKIKNLEKQIMKLNDELQEEKESSKYYSDLFLGKSKK